MVARTTRARRAAGDPLPVLRAIAGAARLGTATYVDHDEPFTPPTTLQWNHGLGEIVTALLDTGMQPTLLRARLGAVERAGRAMVESGDGEWRLTTGRNGCRTRTRCRPSGSANSR